MNVFKCRVCGDPYVGNTKPSNCPFCGAPAKFIILADNWVEPEPPILSDVTRKHLESALKLEVDNVQFYRCAMNATDEPLTKEMFKALSRIESEHASVICKYLNVPKVAVQDVPEICGLTTREEHLEEALRREQEAVKFYSAAARGTTEEPVREFFEAVSEVENDHISLSQLRLGIA
ncbi:MAG: ferritin [Candidatus Abyssobacteria bacterium SURF_5]|uniref:Ferritin n=1 Tax=Abyssobacteria bacterium (strain SURF_5) TaxID=2093360 RepID=A0A3A4NMW0_ABYX5|nr:MAG: ferritin [Candidatus Abyssubacteria bacterium SURF_5]